MISSVTFLDSTGITALHSLSCEVPPVPWRGLKKDSWFVPGAPSRPEIRKSFEHHFADTSKGEPERCCDASPPGGCSGPPGDRRRARRDVRFRGPSVALDTARPDKFPRERFSNL